MRAQRILDDLAMTSDGVFAVDEEQRIIHWNAGARDILGYSADEVLGRPCFEVVGGLDEAGAEVCLPGCPVVECAKRGWPLPGKTVKVKAKDGTYRWLSVTHTQLGGPLLAADSGPVVVHFFREVTAGVEAKAVLNRVARHLAGYGSGSGGPASLNGPTDGGNNYEGPREELTPREKQVAALLVRGEGTAAIAQRLTISNATARNHIQNILAKLGVHTRLEAVAYVLRNRLLDSN